MVWIKWFQLCNLDIYHCEVYEVILDFVRCLSGLKSQRRCFLTTNSYRCVHVLSPFCDVVHHWQGILICPDFTFSTGMLVRVPVNLLDVLVLRCLTEAWKLVLFSLEDFNRVSFCRCADFAKIRCMKSSSLFYKVAWRDENKIKNSLSCSFCWQTGWENCHSVLLCVSWPLFFCKQAGTTEMGMSAQDQHPCWWTSAGGLSPVGRHCI